MVGLSVGLIINLHVVGDALAPSKHSQEAKPPSTTVSDSQNASSVSPSADAKGLSDGASVEKVALGQEELLRQSYVVLDTLKKKDYAALSELVHPQKGLTLTPFSTVDPLKDQTLNSEDLAEAAKNANLYVWGFHDGSGAPIKLSIPDYFEKFVYNEDYSTAPMIGVNTVLSTGNSLENVATAYQNAQFVEFYFPKLDPQNNGLDWCGLKLVFEQVLQKYKLVGLIHSEWTI